MSSQKLSCHLDILPGLAGRLKIKSKFIFWAKDARMFGPVIGAGGENKLNQLFIDSFAALSGHITGPELPNYGANNAING